MAIRTAILACLLLPALGMPATAGSATPGPAGPAERSCSEGTETGLNLCADARFRAADAALNAAYRRMLGRLQDPDAASMRGALVTAERHWISWRDAECAFEASGSSGGSMQPLEIAQCRTRETRSRTAALETMLSCRGGDCLLPAP